MKKENALVLFSGGQDSTTCLIWAKKNFASVEAISFMYGQKHEIELESSRNICQQLKIKRTLIDAFFIAKLGGSDLIKRDGKIKEKGDRGLPTSFVPYRNVFFLTMAASLAYQKKIHHLVIGTCQTDYSGYPDCRDNSIKSIQVALTNCGDYEIVIHTPLMWLSKAETWQLAEDLGCLDIVEKYSHTCYNGLLGGCHECPACKLRELGYQQYLNAKNK